MSGMNELLSAASKGAVTSSNPYSKVESLRKAAIQYLQTRDEYDEEEIEGIVESHFITYGDNPELAYKTIKDTF